MNRFSATICSKCNNRYDKREGKDQAFQELLLREKFLLRKLAIKEQELQDYATQLSAMQNSIQSKTLSSLSCPLQDPAVNLLIQRLRQDLSATKTKLDETQSELNAWKFTPDSNTGKRLMAKCRLLYQENEELGKVINSGRVAKLEAELALQKNFSEEVKKSQSEMDGFLQDLDEDVEGMQSVIYLLQNELQKYKTSIKSPSNTENKESIPKVVNGVKNDVITIETLPSISPIEIPTKLDKTKSDSKSSKHKKPKDSKNLNDSKSKKSKVKKAQSVSIEDTDQSNKNPKVYKIKNKSEVVKSEEKLKKSEKRSHSKYEVAQKKKKISEDQTPIATSNDLQNGS
ncbi:Hypothetical protein CINCED_3A015681 [Cinara cedri]|uniref:Pre-mRNA-splicing regulator female-lethal(2)D n=1 Tax=Cinara cedri TaxID=506608 RepID=A0A5E4MMV4_9HEMI|nr:Hypothetical protein CINCED_3A015681 [Cinara cedri]